MRAVKATVVAALGWAVAVSAAPAAAQVTIVPVREPATTIGADAIAAAQDVSGRSYTLSSEQGDSSLTVDGTSLAALLAAADVDTVFSYLEIDRPGAMPVRLSQDQALGEGAFPDGPPVVSMIAEGTRFLRPSAGEDDLNAGDVITSSGGLTIRLRSGPLLAVEAKASKVKVKPGEPVRFVAEVERAGAGQALDYSWTLDDGTTRAGAQVTHRFRKRGTYEVTVGVTAPGDEAGGSDLVTVVVGKPSERGPDRKGGGTNAHAGAPDSGAADGGSAGGTTGPAPTAPAPAAPPAPAPTPASSEPQPPVERKLPFGVPAKSVTGRLLSGIIRPPGKSLALALSSAARTGVTTPSSAFGLPAVAWAGIGTLVLLGLGAGIEQHYSRPRRRLTA